MAIFMFVMGVIFGFSLAALVFGLAGISGQGSRNEEEE